MNRISSLWLTFGGGRIDFRKRAQPVASRVGSLESLSDLDGVQNVKIVGRWSLVLLTKVFQSQTLFWLSDSRFPLKIL